ncbi:MAG: hypothetical protein GVY23_03805 [Spirochaetes bacterium]|jgi:predicted protein tyrosine phosphatase|nr:hypothetical protein [Spirochaetota bacterium]
MKLPPVQVFGQPELEEHLRAGRAVHTHLISIGNPLQLFIPPRPDSAAPALFEKSFSHILRLTFFDVEKRRHLSQRHFPKRIPRRRDVRRAIRFFRRTRGEASGYTIHCWRGISRSTAIALGYLYMITGSEGEAASTLMDIRPEARPHQGIVRWFDEELGSNLTAVNDELRAESIRKMREELDLTEDSLLEELPVVEEP